MPQSRSVFARNPRRAKVPNLPSGRDRERIVAAAAAAAAVENRASGAARIYSRDADIRRPRANIHRSCTYVHCVRHRQAPHRTHSAAAAAASNRALPRLIPQPVYFS